MPKDQPEGVLPCILCGRTPSVYLKGLTIGTAYSAQWSIEHICDNHKPIQYHFRDESALTNNPHYIYRSVQKEVIFEWNDRQLRALKPKFPNLTESQWIIFLELILESKAQHSPKGQKTS